MHVLEGMLAAIAGIVIVVGVLAAIGYLLLFGRGLARISKRFTDREARRSAAEEQAPATYAMSDDEGPQTD
jgi:hypothetical protein